jgi:hypothetical protein
VNIDTTLAKEFSILPENPSSSCVAGLQSCNRFTAADQLTVTSGLSADAAERAGVFSRGSIQRQTDLVVWGRLAACCRLSIGLLVVHAGWGGLIENRPRGYQPAACFHAFASPGPLAAGHGK